MAEKYCPECKYKNGINATFCVFCGSPLEGGSHDLRTARQNLEAVTGGLHKNSYERIEQPLEIPQKGIAIYSWTDSTPIAVNTGSQFILGRTTPEELDDAAVINHKSCGAYENGVSRRHAVIRQIETGYEIIDLGSTNGTWLEKRQLVPRRPYPLKGVSRIILGRLQLVAVYQTTTRDLVLSERKVLVEKISPQESRTQVMADE